MEKRMYSTSEIYMYYIFFYNDIYIYFKQSRLMKYTVIIQFNACYS